MSRPFALIRNAPTEEDLAVELCQATVDRFEAIRVETAALEAAGEYRDVTPELEREVDELVLTLNALLAGRHAARLAPLVVELLNRLSPAKEPREHHHSE